MTNDTADWIEQAVDFYSTHCLGLTEWNISICIEYAIDDDAGILGMCTQQPSTNYAQVSFRGDIADTEHWHTTIIHELLHIKHSRIDDYLREVAFDALPPKMSNIVNKTYVNVVYEPFIHDMAYYLAKSLYPLWCDYRDSVDDEEDTADATVE